MRDQIAHTIMTYSWHEGTQGIVRDMESPVEAYPLADKILEHTEQVRWCSVHKRSVSDARSTTCLSGGKIPCGIEVRYLLRPGPPPPRPFSDEDIDKVRDEIQNEIGVRLPTQVLRRSLEQLQI